MPGAGALPATLRTDTIQNLEFLRVGPGNPGSRKPAYTQDDLEAVVAADAELRAAGYVPAMKLGHNPDQPLLVKDGLPNAGLVGPLRLNAERTAVVGDVESVPGVIADFIRSGNYGPRSSELWLDQELLPGKKFPLAFKGAAWLGADAPAMKDLNQIRALYNADVSPSVYLDDEGHEVTVVPVAEAEEQLADMMTHSPMTGTHSHSHAAYGAADGSDGHKHEHTHKGDANHQHAHGAAASTSTDDGNDSEPDADADDSMSDAAKAEAVQRLVSVLSTTELRDLLETAEVNEYLRDFSQDERDKLAKSGAALPDGSYPIRNAADLKNAEKAVGRADPSKRDAVRAHIRSRAKALGLENLLTDAVKQESDTRPSEVQEGETMKDTELREFLGLSEEEDLKTAILKLRTQEAASVSLSEHQAVVERLTAIEAKEQLSDATGRVEAMVRAGQIAGPKEKVEKLKEFAVNLCLKDPEAFETWRANQPKVVDYDVLGDPGDGMRPGERVVTAGMANRDLQKAHATFGVTPEQIAEQQLPTEERKRLWRERTLAAAAAPGHPSALRSAELGRVLR